MKKYLATIFILISISSFSQFTDGFADGDLIQNPIWEGNLDSFIVNNNSQLQLNATAAGNSYLITNSTQLNNTQWEFYVRISFSPSANNKVSIFLVSDNNNLSQALNGYFVRIGEAGSNDGIDLYRMDGITETLIIDGIGGTANSGGEFTIKVIRDNLGNWQLFTDVNAESNYTLEGTVNDNTYTTTNYFGVLCDYTTSNSTKFYFDNIYVGNIITDTTAASVTNIEITNQNQLKITFSENLDSISAKNINNYTVNNGIGNPSSVIFNQNNVELNFAQNFVSGLQNTLTINNIADLEGNILNNYDTVFTYIAISQNDIVINEIMADPSPVVGLPDYEFIELYNNTNYNLDLTGWYLKIGTATKELNNFTLLPNSYIIICKQSAEAYFLTYGNVTTVSSLSLTNSGSTIELFNSDSVLINTVSYSSNWYKNENKDDGGWTLERIDPNNNCSALLNWSASNNILGGTPGTENSVFASNIDNEKPYLISSVLNSNNLITLKFSEEIENSSLINLANYNVIGNSISSITFISQQEIELVLANNIESGSQVLLELLNLSDYCGNIINDTAINLNYYNTKQFDIVINEIMADPLPSVYLPEAEYIELYNTSGNEINMHNWTLYYGSYSVILPNITIPADSFILLCKESDLPLFVGYNNIYAVSSFNLSATGMMLSIANNENKIIHSVNYNSSWYKNDNKSDGGWSLEQIDPLNFCGDYNNWQASTNRNGGTPSSINSVNTSNLDNIIPELVRAHISDTNSIVLTLSESIIIDSINASIFSVDNNIGYATSISSEKADNTKIKLIFSANFSKNTIYTLSLNAGVIDCAGNNIDITNTIEFGYATRPQPNDIVINEILFNPLNDGIDYVEIYNRSNNIIDASEIQIANIEAGVLDNIKPISIEPILIFPNTYYLISKHSRIVKQQYTTETEYNYINIETLPTYSNSQGTVVIVDNANIVIDEFEYNEEMHFPTLISVDGVSLERINPNTQTNISSNWHSASETVGFGTPGYQNSQYNPQSNGVGTVSLVKDAFSPDNDGYEDVLVVNYNMEKVGYTVNAYIFDVNGRLMKQIVNNELLAISGSYNWDGIDDYNQKVKIGMYILVFEVFDMEGNANKYKLPFIVAGKIE